MQFWGSGETARRWPIFFSRVGGSLILCAQLACAWIVCGSMAAPARAALSLASAGTAASQNFDGLVTASSMAGLNASGWKASTLANGPVFSTASATLGQVQSAVLNDISNVGSYNFLNVASGTDRAIGFLLGSAPENGPRSILLQVTNNTGQTLNELAMSWSLETYRDGIRDTLVTFFHGSDGSTWTAANQGDQTIANGNSTSGFSPPPAVNRSATVSGLSIAAGSSYYLRWSFASSGTSSGSVAVGLDNFSITGNVSAVPESTGFVLVAAAAGVACGAAAVRRGGRLRRAG